MSIPEPDAHAYQLALQHQLKLTKPTGALGRLEELSAWVCGVQGTFPPTLFSHPAVAIFAGDHGVARTAGTSAYPPEVTAQMVLNFLAGGAAVNVLARQMGAVVRVIDVSVDCDPGYADAIDPSVATQRIRRGSGSIDREDAMSEYEYERALDLGREVADALIDEGRDLLIPGDMGIGNTTSAAALIGYLTDSSAHDVTGRGTGVDDDTLARKTMTVQSAIDRARTTGATDALRIIGAPDIAAMSGFLEQAASRRTPVVLDGVVSCAAALATVTRSPKARQWWTAGHLSTEPATAIALRSMDLAPLIDLHLRLGEGTGALLALPVIEAAILTLNEMATFTSAGVTDR